jgi:hypothetical protein
VVIQVDKRAVLRMRLNESLVLLVALMFALTMSLFGLDVGADIAIGGLTTVSMVQVITTWADLHEDDLE